MPAQAQTIEESKNRAIEMGDIALFPQRENCADVILATDYYNEFAVPFQYSFVCSHSEDV